MYLSQLTLNPWHRDVRRDLGDVQQLHRTLMRAFPQAPETASGPREHFGVLHRLEIQPRENTVGVLVQSLAKPDWGALEREYLAQPARCKSIDTSLNALRENQVLSFRLRANPTKRVRRETDPITGKVWDGKRVALTMQRDPQTGEILEDKDADQLRLEWLQRKADHGGFEIIPVRADGDVPDVRIVPEDRVFGSRRKKTFWPVLYDGHLRITDLEQFRETLARGIGPAKAYGFGLLSLGPPRR